MPVEMLQNGRYRLIRPLGSGGMGEVYLMEDTRINRNVAIKVIRTEAGLNPNSYATTDAARLFQREARAIAALEHPNILPLHDFGEENLNNTTLTYMVMSYCPEGSLADWIRQRGGSATLSPQDIANLVAQAAEGLQYAHDHNVIHLDVKPPNFLLRSNQKNPNRPHLLLADFGVAKMNATTSGSSQTVRGTPASMAPEQWSSTPVPATDQYALAVMTYELLTGRPPFLGGLEQMMYQHFHTEPPPPSTFNPRLSRDVDAVLLRALAKRPEARFSSISAFANAFGQAAQSLPAEQSIRPGQPNINDIRATLAISKDEALTGTSRIITLPGGRRVTVMVPAGAYNGQVIRLQSPQEPANTASPVDTIMLNLVVQQTETIFSGPNAQSAEKTVRASNPNLQGPSHPNLPVTVFAGTPPPSASNAPVSDPNHPPVVSTGTPPSAGVTFPAFNANVRPGIAPPPPDPRPVGMAPSNQQKAISRSPLSKGMAILLIVLVFVLIAGGVGLFSIINANQVATSKANATATANAFNATGTAAVDATGTAHTAASNATGTAQANINATSTALPLTATANAYQSLYNNATSGTPVLNDPLSDNTQGNGWPEGTGNNGACTFTGGDYHVNVQSSNYIHYCSASPDFSNLAFEVQMKIDKGDGGGVLFRSSSSGNTQYMFSVDQNGSYSLFLCDISTCHTGSPLAHGNSSVINQGLGQTNLITVVAQGSAITLYVNRHEIASVIDSTYNHGQVGLIAYDNTNSTEIEYGNAKVWKL